MATRYIFDDHDYEDVLPESVFTREYQTGITIIPTSGALGMVLMQDPEIRAIYWSLPEPKKKYRKFHK